MKMHASMPDAVRVILTETEQVPVPRAMLEQAGLTPGKGVIVTVNAGGEVVLRAETHAERKARILQAIDELAAQYSTGQTTEDYMAMMRGTDDRAP